MERLREVFPGAPARALRQALEEHGGSTEAAVDALLRDSGRADTAEGRRPERHRPSRTTGASGAALRPEPARKGWSALAEAAQEPGRPRVVAKLRGGLPTFRAQAADFPSLADLSLSRAAPQHAEAPLPDAGSFAAVAAPPTREPDDGSAEDHALAWSAAHAWASADLVQDVMQAVDGDRTAAWWLLEQLRMGKGPIHGGALPALDGLSPGPSPQPSPRDSPCRPASRGAAPGPQPPCAPPVNGMPQRRPRCRSPPAPSPAPRPGRPRAASAEPRLPQRHLSPLPLRGAAPRNAEALQKRLAPEHIAAALEATPPTDGEGSAEDVYRSKENMYHNVDDLYRIERRAAHQLTRQWRRRIRQAATAYAGGDPGTARALASEAAALRSTALDAHAAAAVRIEAVHNAGLGMLRLDLHGLHAGEALAAVDRRLASLCSGNLRQGLGAPGRHPPSLEIIVGRGGNSSGGEASLGRVVAGHLQAAGRRFAHRAGVIVVELRAW